MAETNVAFAGSGSWIFTFSAVLGPKFVMATVKLKSWAASGAAPFNDLPSERSADGVAACTVNGTLSSRLPPPESTFTFHVPRLSTTKMSTTLVSVEGSTYESVCGSAKIGVKVLTKLAGSTQAKRLLELPKPTARAQTV